MKTAIIKIFFLLILSLFASTSSAFAQTQQLQIQTNETKGINEGTCSMKVGDVTLDGTIENGVCTLPNDPTPTPTATIPDTGNTTGTTSPFNLDVKDLTSPIFKDSKDLSDILNVNVSKEVKDNVNTSEIVGTVLLTVAVASPIALGFVTPSLFLPSLFLIAGIRKRRPWGIVYDVSTQKPIPFAVVRLMDADNNQFVKDTVTDTEGRFTFIADTGRFFLDVKAQGYKNIEKKVNVLTSEIYSGEILDIVSGDVKIVVRVPMYPINTETAAVNSLLLFIRKHIPDLFRVLVAVMLFVSALVFFFHSSLLNLLTLLIYLVLFLFIWRNIGIYSRSFGNIFNLQNKVAIPSAFVKLMDPKSGNQVNDLVISDKKGRFPLLAEDGRYYLNVESNPSNIKYATLGAKIISPSTLDINYKKTSRLDIGVGL